MCNVFVSPTLKKIFERARKMQLLLQRKSCQKILNVGRCQQEEVSRLPSCASHHNLLLQLGGPDHWKSLQELRLGRLQREKSDRKILLTRGKKAQNVSDDKEFDHKKSVYSVIATKIWNFMSGQWDWIYCVRVSVLRNCFPSSPCWNEVSNVLWCHPLAKGGIQFLA